MLKARGAVVVGVLAAVLGGAAAVDAAPAAPQFGAAWLERGDRGDAVRELQRVLGRLGYSAPVDGMFGTGTERTLRRYERREGLSPDGKVSPGQARGMRRRAEASGFGKRTLDRGDRGRDVRRLQRLLNELGRDLEVDGVFGRGTERRVRGYERAEELRVDGRVSPAQARGILRRAERRRTQGTPAPEENTDGSASGGAHVFPIRGEHDLGRSETNNFGGGRNHQGQDMFAACGTPLVAAQGGTVKFVGSQSRAGNYVVISGESSTWDYAYMHLGESPLVEKGQRVSTGQPIGAVGDSGNASGCQLHFELWNAPGWYEGGAPFDPLPQLREWDAAS